MKSPVSDREDLEVHLVIEDPKPKDPEKETKTEKTAFYVGVLLGWGCFIVLWALAVFLTCFYAIVIRHNDDGLATASIPLVSSVVFFILMLPFLVSRRMTCYSECEGCQNCYPFTALILGLLMLLAAVLVTLSAGGASSGADKAFGGITAGVNFIYGLGVMCTLLYRCSMNRR